MGKLIISILEKIVTRLTTIFICNFITEEENIPPEDQTSQDQIQMLSEEILEMED